MKYSLKQLLLFSLFCALSAIAFDNLSETVTQLQADGFSPQAELNLTAYWFGIHGALFVLSIAFAIFAAVKLWTLRSRCHVNVDRDADAATGTRASA